MKKLTALILAMIVLVAFAGTAFADVCVEIRRAGTWLDDLKTNEVNSMINDGSLTREEYDARIQPYDIIDVYHDYKCPTPAVITTGADSFSIIIKGLDYDLARRYLEHWNEFTGETDPETGEEITYIKRIRKFRVSNNNLPGPISAVVENDDYIVLQWSDIRGYVENKLTGSIGEQMKRFVITFLICYLFAAFAFPVWAADDDVYVDTDASCVGDDGSISNPWCTLNTAIVNEVVDVTGFGPGDNLVFHVKGTIADTTKVYVNGYTTDSDNKIIIQTTEAYGDDGRNTTDIYSTSFYRLEVTAASINEYCIFVREEYVEIYGLQLHIINNDYSGSKALTAELVSTSVMKFGYLRVRGTITGTGDTSTGISIGDSDITATIYNTVVYDFVNSTGNSYGIYVTTGTVNIYNVTLHNNYLNIRNSGTTTAYNTISYDAVGAGYSWFGIFSGDYNAQDTTDADMPGANSIDSISDPFTAIGSDDYSLSAASDVEDEGKDLDADLSVGWQDDIIGTDRDAQGVAWDIGAFEYEAGGTTTTTTTTTITTTTTSTTTTTTSTTTTTLPTRRIFSIQ